MSYFNEEDIKLVEATVESMLETVDVERPATFYLISEQPTTIDEEQLREYLG